MGAAGLSYMQTATHSRSEALAQVTFCGHALPNADASRLLDARPVKVTERLSHRTADGYIPAQLLVDLVVQGFAASGSP